MAPAVVRSAGPLGFPFKALDPFLFVVYHNDRFPVGNEKNMNFPRRGNGADFDWSSPYRMYHGDKISGFPMHPHRGFETLTLVQEGTCDHSDSLGASGRMTAGVGVVHGENFPLVHTTKPNTLRLFQIWLNLPKKSKFAPPSYVMLWAEAMPFLQGENGAECEVAAGSLGGASAGAPPPNSWAADPDHDVGVFYITIPPGGSFTLPPASRGAPVNRMAYVVEGPISDVEGLSSVRIGGASVPHGGRAVIELDATQPCAMEHAGLPGSPAVHVLVLQGVPIGEPVAQQGPFVMNSKAEIAQAHADYQKTQFGGWPWDADAVVFDRSQGRFADMVAPDGTVTRTLPPLPAKAEL